MTRRRHIASLVALVLAATAACTDPDREIDPFPVEIDTSAGAVMLFASGPDFEPAPVTVDTLSPITILDSFRGGDTLADGRRIALDLTLFSAPPVGAPVPRITLPSSEVFDIHPCDRGGPPVDCLVGVDSDTRVIRGIVGADALARSAVRFDFAGSELRFFPDTAGTDADRGKLCEAVFAAPFAGGGTLIVADGEVDYIGRRPAIGACLDLPGGDNLVARGVDALLVIGTGLGISILSESAYDRYAIELTLPIAAELPTAVVHLPSGPVVAGLGEVGEIALLGEVGEDSAARGPCGELFASRAMAVNGCETGAISADDCPCPGNQTFCRAGAGLVLSEPIAVAVLPDEHELLQALRVELRPEFAEVDGIVGAAALAATRLELDYPSARIVARCEDETRCEARPQLILRADLDEFQACVGEQ